MKVDGIHRLGWLFALVLPALFSAACSSPTSSSSTTPAVSSTAITFPATTIGGASASSFTVSATAATTIGVEDSDTADFPYSTTCAVSLPAGSSCSVTVQFQPRTPGALVAWITINSLSGKTAVALSGTATGTALTSVPTPGTLQIVTAQANPFYLAPGQTTVLGATLVGASGGLQDITTAATWLSSDPTVATISPAGVVTAVGGGTCSLTALYQGHSAEIRVLVVGTMTFSPASFTFPATSVGQQSAIQTFTATVAGGPNMITAITSSRPSEFVVMSTTCDTTAGHAAGYACAIQVAFDPAAAGLRTGQIVVTGVVAGSAPSTLTLTGTGQ